MGLEDYHEIPRGDDSYHPHYPSVDRDYHQRIIDTASKKANPFRLMCAKYTPAQEVAIYNYWRAKKA